MSEIRLLSQETIDRIAAGEVVERPASVVKELVENSMDAGAGAVTVEIRDGGISMIRVTDNGEGIAPSQVKEAFLRHATSKITDASDLVGVRSLGFRGEALSSISAVARVELITKRDRDITGVRFTINGGAAGEMEEIGAPGGSTFIVRNLFYNTPARKKFLKSPAAEAGYISDLMEHLALSRPEISFKFINNGQVRLHTSGNGKLRDVIYAVYGRETAAGLVEVAGLPEGGAPAAGPGREAEQGQGKSAAGQSHAGQGITVRGFIGKPDLARGSRNYETCFVAGRFVRDKIVMKAIEDGYGNRLMQHRFPFTVLFIEVPEGGVDVNVHPAKLEVRFADNAAVYEKVRDTVHAALERRELIPDAAPGSMREERQERKAELRKRAESFAAAPEPFEEARRARLLRESGAAAEPVSGAEAAALSGRISGAEAAALSGRAPGAEAAAAPGRAPEAEAVAVPGPACAAEPTSARTEGPLPPQAVRELREDLLRRSGSPYAPRYGDGAALVREPETARIPQREQAGRQAPAGQQAEAPEEAQAARPVQQSLFDGRLLAPGNVQRHRLIGQVLGTYWIVEFDDSLYIIDQHAAHEKVIYERMVRAMRDRCMTSQQLLIPVIVTMSLAQETLFGKYRHFFDEMGFEVEHFGGREYAVRAVPDNLYGFTDEELFIQMLDSLSETTGAPGMEFVFEKLAQMACKAAIKGRHAYSAQEANALIGELLELENPYNCPHGRPTIIRLSRYEIERKFKRIVD